MTDTIELKSILVKKGLTLKKLSTIIGISTTTLSYKINNKREFSSSEIAAMQEVLDLTKEERDRIFFAKDVDLKSTKNCA